MAPSSLLLVLLVGLVLDGAAARRRAQQAEALGGQARQGGDADADAELQDVSKTAAEDCAADVSGESVTMARCRATCLHQFPSSSPSAPSAEEAVHAGCRAMDVQCMTCWELCDRAKWESQSKPMVVVCRDPDSHDCREGCRAACKFHLPLGAPGAGASRALRPTNEASAVAPPRAMQPPRFAADGLSVRWQGWQLPDAAPATPSDSDSATSSTSTASPAAGPQGPEGEEGDEEPRRNVAPTDRNVVFIVSAKLAPSTHWKELLQTADLEMELRPSLRDRVRALSVLAVTVHGPVARSSTCSPPSPPQQHNDERDYYLDDEDADDEDDDDDDDDADSTAASASGSSPLPVMVARNTFKQLQGTEQPNKLYNVLLRDPAVAKRIVEDAALDEDGDASEADDEDDDVDDQDLARLRRVLPKLMLGVRQQPEHRAEAAPAEGWGLHLLGVSVSGGNLPRARVAWTPPSGVSDARVYWDVPALHLSGIRIVNGEAKAEVPLVEQHATRITVGDAHSSNMSPALVLQLSVQTDVTAAANGLSLPSPPELASWSVRATHSAVVTPPAPSYGQAALWEATLVAVGLVVGAAALCVALLLVAYGVHSRVARCCRGRSHGMHGIHGIHAKSASVEPLNGPDHNNV